MEATIPFLRKPVPELLDEDSGSSEEVASALRSLRFVNRWFGGNAVHRELLREASGARRELAVLEVAAGRATALAAASLALQPLRLRCTLLDRQRSHLPKDWPRRLPPPSVLEGDALAIPLPDNSVDVVSSCLFLHHLDPEQAGKFLREALRVARVAVIVNDLERTRTHYVLAKLFSLIDPSRISRHDGPVSVRQSYSVRELAAMFARTGCEGIVRRRFLFRLAAILWVKQK